jgi:hypothetical protein
MIDEQKEVTKFLNSNIPYWDGLKSRDFWKEFKITGKFKFSPVYWLIGLGGVYAGLNARIDSPNVAAPLLIGSLSLLGLSVWQVHNQLRLYQLNKQLRIIQLAQEKQEK